MDEYFEFLDELRDSGKINMFAAAPTLQDAFDLSRVEARDILNKYMERDD